MAVFLTLSVTAFMWFLVWATMADEKQQDRMDREEQRSLWASEINKEGK